MVVLRPPFPSTHGLVQGQYLIQANSLHCTCAYVLCTSRIFPVEQIATPTTIMVIYYVYVLCVKDVCVWASEASMRIDSLKCHVQLEGGGRAFRKAM